MVKKASTFNWVDRYESNVLGSSGWRLVLRGLSLSVYSWKALPMFEPMGFLSAIS